MNTTTNTCPSCGRTMTDPTMPADHRVVRMRPEIRLCELNDKARAEATR